MTNKGPGTKRQRQAGPDTQKAGGTDGKWGLATYRQEFVALGENLLRGLHDGAVVGVMGGGAATVAIRLQKAGSVGREE